MADKAGDGTALSGYTPAGRPTTSILAQVLARRHYPHERFMPITLLDIILLVVMLISALLAMVRGFMREVLSIVSWAAAAVLTIYAYPRLLPVAKQYVNHDLIAAAVVIAGVFLGTLLLVSIITIKVSDKVLDSRVGALDRTLGFLFGLGRGLVIVVVAFLFFNWLVLERSQPEWVREAKSKAVLQGTGQWLMSVLPDDPETTILKRLKRPKGDEQEPQDAPPEQRTDTGTGRDKAKTGEDQPGYERADRLGMQQLLNSATPKPR